MKLLLGKTVTEMSPLKHSVLIKTALVNQDGNVNVAVQDQRTLTNMAKGSEAIIRQNGNFNKAEQMQKERTTMRKLLKMVIVTKLDYSNR
jgi:hypothetical protein